MLMMTTYHFKIEKVKFDKNVNIPIPGALKFLVPREDIYTNPEMETEIAKVFRQIVRTLNEKGVQNGKSEDGNNYRRGSLSGN